MEARTERAEGFGFKPLLCHRVSWGKSRNLSGALRTRLCDRDSDLACILGSQAPKEDLGGKTVKPHQVLSLRDWGAVTPLAKTTHARKGSKFGIKTSRVLSMSWRDGTGGVWGHLETEPGTWDRFSPEMQRWVGDEVTPEGLTRQSKGSDEESGHGVTGQGRQRACRGRSCPGRRGCPVGALCAQGGGPGQRKAPAGSGSLVARGGVAEGRGSGFGDSL